MSISNGYIIHWIMDVNFIFVDNELYIENYIYMYSIYAWCVQLICCI